MSIKNMSDKKRQKLENKIIEGGLADNDHRFTVPKNSTANLDALDRHEGSIAYDTDLDKLVFDNGSGFAAITPTDITLDDVTLTGTLSTDSDIVSVVEDYTDQGSFQAMAADVTVNDAGGSDDGTDPSFLAGVMGNILGEAVQGEGNYLAGVIGAISITDPASDYPTGGVLGIVMDGVTGIDGAVVAVIDGSDPSAETRARAAYAVRMLNNNEDSGVDYGVDLYDAGSIHYTGTGEDFTVDKAELRTSKEVCLMNAAAAPVDGTTGDDFAGSGSLYIDTDNPTLYMNTGTKADPVWSEVRAAAEDSFVATFDNAVGAKTVVVRKMGNLVTLEIPSGSTADGGGAVISSGGTDLPAAYRPDADLSFVVIVTDNAAPAFGQLKITSAGALVFSVAADETVFTDDAAAGFNRVAVTYTLA